MYNNAISIALLEFYSRKFSDDHSKLVFTQFAFYNTCIKLYSIFKQTEHGGTEVYEWFLHIFFQIYDLIYLKYLNIHTDAYFIKE